MLFFVALFETLRRLVHRPTLAVTTTATAGIVIWAFVVARGSICEGGECWDDVLVVAAAVLAGIWWARLRRRRPARTLRRADQDAADMIIPAATVSFVDSSIRMKAPVARLSA